MMLLPLVCAYFLNGGVGLLTQPVSSSGSGPPPVTHYIVTGTGTPLATGTGSILVYQ